MIVFPMVGLSSRFFKEGYTLPKYQLPLGEATVFSKVVESFKSYFDTDDFLFLCRSDYNAEQFVTEQLIALGVKNFQIRVFSENTRGQAETVYLGTQHLHADTELFIFNIDTLRPGFVKPDFLGDCDGYLEVFEGEGSHWSFVLPGEGDTVVRTTEKERISNLCSDGLYYFKRKSCFDDAFIAAVNENQTAKGEFYIAPLYNNLIYKDKIVKYQKIGVSDLLLCGTPEEYQKLSNIF